MDCARVSKLRYDADVKRLNPAMVAAVALISAGLVFLVPAVSAQINGTPSSVSSINFGGHPNSTPGVPSSITSLGPNGVQPRNPFFNQPACCINPLFPVNRNPGTGQHQHHHRGQFFPSGGTAVYVPYAYPVVGEPDGSDAAAEADQPGNPPEDYRGGPTIFDRRGDGQKARFYDDDYPLRRRQDRADAEPVPAAPPADTPVPDQPKTVLVYKDGHQLEVQNYAVIGDTLYDLTPGRHHKILLADLDLASTTRQNDDRGIDFRLPPTPAANK